MKKITHKINNKRGYCPKYIHIAFILLICLLCKTGSAAYFRNISIEQGLSQSTANDIAQDNNGFIWISTSDGLNRYDGKNFIHFKPKKNSSSQNALTSSGTFHIAVDEDGNLWINSKKGLNFLDTTTYKIKHYLHDPDNPNSLSSNSINSIKFDSHGFLWIHHKMGLDRLSPKTNQFKHFIFKGNKLNYQCSPISNYLFIDQSNKIWIASDKGLCVYDPNSNNIEIIDYQNNPAESALYGVNEIIQDNNDILWIATTGNGLFKFNQKTKMSIAFKHDPKSENSIAHNTVVRIKKFQKHYLWIATAGGLSLLDKRTNTFINFTYDTNNKNSISSNNLISLFIDQSGLIWAGSKDSGIDIFNPTQLTFKHIGKNTGKKGFRLSDSSVWNFNKAYGYIWIATGNGLNRFDLNSGNIKHYQSDPNKSNSLANNVTYDVYPGRNRDLWISCWPGLSHFSIDDERFENFINSKSHPNILPFNNILSLYYDIDENLVWVGTFGMGLFSFNPKTKQFSLISNTRNNSKDNSYIMAIEKINNSNLLYATRSGLILYDFKNKYFNELSYNSPELMVSFNDIKNSKNNNILLASDDGLIILDSSTFKPIKSYSTQDGLDDDKVYSIEEDHNGNIWVGTNLGLSRINPKTDEIRNFDISDGLQGYEFNAAASFFDGEYLFFGGFNGFNYFNPDDIKTEEYAAPVKITGFSIHNKPLNSQLIHKPIQLSYKESFFSIEFAALDYTNPIKNKYAYMLDGFDQDWIYSENRNYASYTNLDGGDYTFKVKAANKYGVWNHIGTSLLISITPPFWETLWFRFSAVIAIILIIFSIYALRVRSIKNRNKMLKQEVQARTTELEEQKMNLEDTLLELGETKDALIEAAHKAGMADTATGVLHNVGNILNSVNTSACLIRETLSNSVITKFYKANQILKQNSSNLDDFLRNNPKAKQLINYYLKLEEYFENESRELKDNALRLTQKISSIDEVINAQQRYAQGHDFIEELSLLDILDDTMNLQVGSIDRHEITIEKFFDEKIPKIPVQKIKLVQILLNLYKNAKESMDANKSNKNILTLEIFKDNYYAYIKVSDTGMGIEKNQLEKIFSHGYSTKKEGHGFGLHTSANYMAQMKGKMWAESKGIGTGATFILKFPLKQENTQLSNGFANEV